MELFRTPLCLAILCPAMGWLAFGQEPAPEAESLNSVVARMRDAALHYADGLQDFLCTQTTTRSADQSGSGKRWKLLETQELELGYIAHKEHYRLLKVNGQTTDLEKRVKKGYFRPGGEFGTALRWIFDPKAKAEVAFDPAETSALKQRDSCVYRYHVPVTTTTYIMQADADFVKMAHHGFVTADCSTGMVTRIRIESEPASVRRMGREIALGMQLDVRYGFSPIGTSRFLLPQEVIEIARFGKTLTKAEIRFAEYRKYESTSNITFDDTGKP